MNTRQWQIGIRSLRQLCRFRLRSALLVLSAALGVSGVVCSVNYGASGTKQVLEQIQRMGTNVLIVMPSQSRAIAGRSRTGAAVTTLGERDYKLIKEDLQHRTRSSALVTQSYRSKAGDLSKVAAVVGCEPDYFVIKDWSVTSGELFDVTQERTGQRMAVLGSTVAVDLFGMASPVGSWITINRVPFTVVGVLAERGQGLDATNEDDQIYVPLTTAMRRLMNVDHYSGMVVEIDSLVEMDQSAEQIGSMLHRLHHIQPGEPDDFQVQNQKSLIDVQLAAASRLKFLLRWIGMSALTVSGLGIVVITWIAVEERTREIGTRRALGATSNDIFLQTAFEGDAVALTGGLLGAAISWPASQLISNSAGLPFVFDWQSCVIAFAGASLLNLTFSILPARHAASVSPIEALRHE